MRQSALIAVLLPAILVVSLFVYIRVVEYNQLTDASNFTVTSEDLLQIPILPGDPIIGELNAPITIISFEDLACAGCATQNSYLNALQEKHPEKVKIIWKSLSVTNLPFPTRQAHAYAYCANQLGNFSAFKDLAFANRNNLSEEILDQITQEIGIDLEKMKGCALSPQAQEHDDQNELVARALQIQAVPAFFINNSQMPAPSSVSEWESILGL